MVKRRTVMWGLLGVGATVASCRPNASTSLKVKLLARSVPSQVLKAFERENAAQFEAESSLVDIYQQLQQWQAGTPVVPPLWRRLFSIDDSSSPQTVQPAVETHLVTLSDPWLDHAIRQQLIQPLPEIAMAENLPESWQK